MRLKPIHITELVAGDVIRVAMRNGYHLEKSPQGILFSRDRPRSARSYSKTVFLGLISSNDPENGVIHVIIQDSNVGQRHVHYPADILYKNIRNIQKYVTDVRRIKDNSPKTHPGAKAFGSTNEIGLMTLIPVRK